MTRPRADDTRSPWRFFLVVFALSTPVYLASPFVRVPGLPKDLPVLDLLLAFTPLAAACILTRRAEGGAAVRRLLARAADHRRAGHWGWFAAAVLLPPTTTLLALGGTRLLGGEVPARPGFAAAVVLAFVVVFLVAAAGEELGWMGYAAEPLMRRWGAVGAALVLGPVWWLWHVPSIVQSGQSPVFMASGIAAALGVRALAVWFYAGAHSCVSVVIVFHAAANLGSAFLPAVPAAGPVTAVVAAVVFVGWRVAPRRTRGTPAVDRRR